MLSINTVKSLSMIYLIFFSPFLTHLWIGLISCAVYHIVPSPDHYCPVESCLTLSSFAANASLYLDNNTSLIFQPGSHIIRSKLNVIGVANFSMISDQSRAGITCENDSNAEFIFNDVNHIHVSNLKFYECYCDIDFYFDRCAINILTLTASSLVLVNCNFEDNVGTGVINAANSNITIAQSTFKDNHHRELDCRIFTFIYCNVTIVSGTFMDNGGILLSVGSNGLFYDDEIIQLPNTFIITDCEFRNNHQSISAFLIYNRIIDVHNSDILSIYDTTFIGNKAATILSAKGSVVNTNNSTFIYNYASSIMELTDCKVDIHNSVFNNNEETALNLQDSRIQIRGSEFKENVGGNEGGAIKCFGKSSISFSETCTFTDNKAWRGAAIYLGFGAQCFVTHGATVIIANNTASHDGGGIYLDDQAMLTLHSQSILKILRNEATYNGGGIYVSECSSINLGNKSHNISQTSNATIYFSRNRARIGGGLYLDLNSVAYIFPCLNNIINFDKNSADYGGAVYVLTAAEYYYSDNPECFFQSETLQNPAQNYSISNGTMKCNKKPFIFSLNRANYLGFTLYKDAFNNCSIDGTPFNEFELLSILSNMQTSGVSSPWVQVCFCENRLPECSRQISYINIKTGEKLALDVAIVDRGNYTVYGSIKSEIGGSIQILDDQKIQDVKNGCTSLIFNIIYSLEASQQLIMSPLIDSDSIHTGSNRSIKINFLACINCPIGFQQIKDDVSGCDCVCDEVKLGSYILTCNYTRETITKKGTTTWITYLSIKNISDYLIYPYCPMDYCFPPDVTVEINLNIPNGADAQCAHNHSGLLCGACSPGLSLSLGSSRCLPCYPHWPGVLVVIVISSLLAGLILVASLLMLNLTVAAGTLNGLIFYANIVAANHYKFFPSASFISVFVSWLNLDLGIDTCFFDGMDFYWKTWIQLAFPAYVLLLVVLVIIVSEHSVKFAQIVGKRNPIATMDTLILFCYVKFLRTVIVAFSFATLNYPDGSHPVVWWSDANVGYFSGKHIVLWAVAAIIFLTGFIYTILLFFWQWLLYYQHKTIFKWMQSPRLRMFIEPYHAPYAFKHRYWTGLLLLLRVFVYIISAADSSGDRGITLLAIGIIANTLLILISCQPYKYKSWPVEVLEIVCIANIAGLCLATAIVRKNQDVVGYISGTISLVLYLIVLTYHAVTQLFFKTQLGRKFKNKLDRQFTDSENEEQVNFVTTQESEEGKPVTYLEIDPPPRVDAAVPLSYFVNLRSRRGNNDSLSESAANHEENELRPIEQEISSSIPYNLMK